MTAARLIFVFLLTLSLFIYSTPLVQALSTPVDISAQNYRAPQNADYGIINLLHSFFCQLAGASPVGQCIGLTGQKEQGNLKAYLYDQLPGGGAIGGLTTVTVAMYNNPPTSTTQYLASLGSNFGLIDQAQAQVIGSGSNIVQPVQILWQVVRNFAYILFTIIFVVVGVALMFRQKLGTSAAITIQTALPGLVIGLILVTFSYFISALLVDSAFVGIQLVTQIFIQTGSNAFGKPEDVQKLADQSNIVNLFLAGTGLLWDSRGQVGGAAQGTITSLGNMIAPGQGENAGALLTGILGTVAGFIVLGPLGAFVGGAGGALAPQVISLIVPLLLIIGLFIACARTALELIKCYVAILLSTVISPITILQASMPGKSKGLEGWWKTILANSLVFPAVFGAFLLSGFILTSDAKNWGATPPLFGEFSTEMIRVLIAYVIILGIPAVPGAVKKAIGASDSPNPFQGEALGNFNAGRGSIQSLWAKGAEPYIAKRKQLREKYTEAMNEEDPVKREKIVKGILDTRAKAGRLGDLLLYSPLSGVSTKGQITPGKISFKTFKNAYNGNAKDKAEARTLLQRGAVNGNISAAKTAQETANQAALTAWKANADAWLRLNPVGPTGEPNRYQDYVTLTGDKPPGSA